MRLEIIVETLEDALAAQEGGATQLDLKAHYPCRGGITPSHGMMVTIMEKINIPVVMMVRPHTRTFHMTPSDIAVASADIVYGRELGVRDFMFGCLTEDGKLDVPAVRKLKEAGGDSRIHMHLAWELSADPWQALQSMMDMGFSSIHTGGLSSGGKSIGGSAVDSSTTIKKIAEIVKDRMEIFLAGSVSAENAAILIQSTGVSNLHCGRGVRTPPTADGYVDSKKVKELRYIQTANN